MAFLVDTRYVLPPLINLIVWIFIIPLAKHWAQDYPNFNNDIFVVACLSLAISILLTFLFISVKLPLTMGTLQLRAGDFSTPLTLSFLASIFFPSPLFWSAFLMLLMLVILSSRYEMLLQAIPAPIPITTQRPDQVELEAIVIEGNNEASNILFSGERRKMPIMVDMRYVVPPLINLTFWLFIIPLAKLWAQDPNFNNDIFVVACLSLAISILLTFLFISVKLPLTVGTLQLRAGDFSTPLTISILASIFFPSPLFWSAFLMLLVLVILSTWFEMLLQATPAPIITHITQRPDQVELEAIVVEA